MATITGTNLLEQFLADRGITGLSDVAKAGIIARLDAMLAAGSSDLAIAAYLQTNPVIKATVPAGQDPIADIGAGITLAKEEIDPVTPPTPPGETFTLTTAIDIVGPESTTFKTTDGDDTVNGVASSLSSERTLNEGDQIDGGLGEDTLNVDMKGNFAGFTGAGFLKNVETVVLNNAGTIARTFTASGVTGVQEYVLNAETAAVALAELGSTDSLVTVNNQASGKLSIGYAATVTSGTADEQVIALNNVGTVADEAAIVSEAAVTIDAAGIETISLSVTGDNVVDMGAGTANPKAINASGEGSLKITAVGANLKTVDASAVTGDVFAVIDNGSGVTSVKTGSGNDTIVADMQKLPANATIAAGTGADEAVLHNGTGTYQYAMSGVETLSFGAQSGDVKLSGANTTGVTTVNLLGEGNEFEDFMVATSGVDQDVELVGFGTAALTYNLLGENANAKTIKSDASGAATINVTADGSGQTNVLDVNLTAATSVALNVSAEMSYEGATGITAAKATSLEATIDGTIDSTITLAAAGSAVITATNSKAVNVVELEAAKLTDLNITSAGDFELNTTGSGLAVLEALTVDTEGFFDGNATANQLINAAVITLSGAGSAELGDLGSGTSGSDYAITVNASELAGTDTANSGALEIGDITTQGQKITLNAANVVGDVIVGNIDAGSGAGATTYGDVVLDLTNVEGDISVASGSGIFGRDVNINASNAQGEFVVGAITATRDLVLDLSSDALTEVSAGSGVVFDAITVDRNFTFKGADLLANDLSTNGGVAISGTTFVGDLTGGIEADTFAFTGTGTTTSITLKGNLGIGTNTVDIDATGNSTSAATIDVSGLNAGVDGEVEILTYTGATGLVDTIKLSASSVETVVVGSVTSGAVDKVVGFSAADFISVAGGSGAVAAYDNKTAVTFTKGTGTGQYADLAAVATELLDGVGTVEASAQVDIAVTFVFDNKTYVLIADDTNSGYAAGDDAIIEITGITSANLTTLKADNFLI